MTKCTWICWKGSRKEWWEGAELTELSAKCDLRGSIEIGGDVAEKERSAVEQCSEPEKWLQK